MGRKKFNPYSLATLSLIMIFAGSPAFGEVTSLQVNSESFLKGEQIEFSGSVEENSGGLVTIVIRDHNDEFVQLTQTIINHDDSFEKIITINNNFSDREMYTATGFILNATKGVTTNFVVSLNDIPVVLEDVKNMHIIEENIHEEIYEIENTPIIKTVDFVDPNKSSQHYIDRYYNEVNYKSWFDRNYPELTIEEAVNHNNDINSAAQVLIHREILPKAEASSLVQDTQTSNNNSEIAEILLVITGLGILFGAGIKKKADGNSKQILINKDIIRQKLIRLIIGITPREILQTRLVKGEISLEEYEKLKTKLD